MKPEYKKFTFFSIYTGSYRPPKTHLGYESLSDPKLVRHFIHSVEWNFYKIESN